VKRVKIYLDNSVLNRPYDDQRQPRVWLETLCFVLILQMVEKGEAELIRSAFHVLENNESRVAERRDWVEACLNLATHTVRSTGEMEQRCHRAFQSRTKTARCRASGRCGKSRRQFFYHLRRSIDP
jgi:hypothetical protein